MAFSVDLPLCYTLHIFCNMVILCSLLPALMCHLLKFFFSCTNTLLMYVCTPSVFLMSSALLVSRQLEIGRISTLFFGCGRVGHRKLAGSVSEGVYCGEFILMEAPIVCHSSSAVLFPVSLSFSLRPAPFIFKWQDEVNKIETELFSQIIF